jgi:hypothetical protein
MNPEHESQQKAAGQVAQCCFCRDLTSDGSGGDGVRMVLSHGRPRRSMEVWAHITCLSERVTPEIAGYVRDVFSN